MSRPAGGSWPWVTPAGQGERGTVLWLGGPMTEEAVRGWEGLLDQLWETGPCSAVLDLGAVTVLTGPAVEALARAGDAARRTGAGLEVRAVPQQAARLLHWAHLDHLISSYRDEAGPVVAAEWGAMASSR